MNRDIKNKFKGGSSMTIIRTFTPSVNQLQQTNQGNKLYTYFMGYRMFSRNKDILFGLSP